jgi:hypothetical protein
MHRDGMVAGRPRTIRQSGGMMGALYLPTVDGIDRPLIYAYDDDDARAIIDRWYHNPEDARIKLYEEDTE